MTKKHIYGGKVSNVSSASGAKEIIIRSGANIFFRVYRKNGEFTDYEILHNDLSVTIEEDELASFYSNDDHFVLDHSPNVLNLEKEQ